MLPKTSFTFEPEPPRGLFLEAAAGVRRMVAANESGMTYYGTNTYLIEADDGLYVLDPGPADDERHFEAIVSALGNRGKGIILTHHHCDHFGLVPRLKAQTGLRVWASSLFPDDTFRPDVPLQDGDRVAGLTAVHTPGHASDHLCFRRDDGVLFSGDHVMSWNSSIVMLPDGNMADYCQGLRRLIAGEDRLYLPGHGPVLPDPLPYVRTLLQRRMEREQEIAVQIATTPSTVQEIATALYRKTDESLIWAAERNVEAHLDKLMREGRAIQADGRWRAVDPDS